MMKHLLTIVLCLTTLTGLAQEEKIKKSEWWNGNPSYAVPIREVNVTARRPMKEIGIQKTQLDTTILHENIALSMADILTFNTSIFVKQYGRATLSTVAFRGTSPSHTQVTWNGMRINSPMLGMTDFSMIPSYFIDDASLLHGTSSVNEAGGGLGGAVKLSTRPADADGFNLQYTQGVGSFSTFDEFLRLTYGNDRWQTSTRVVYSSSPNDFKYRNYDKNVLILDDDHNIIGSYYPIERNKSGAYHDFHALQEVYYNTGHGDRFGLQAWYVNSKRGLPMLSVDHKENDDYLNQQREQTLRSILSWDHLRKKWKVGVKAGYIHTWMAYDYERELGNGKMEKMIRSRSTINTFFGQVDGEYYLGEKWLFTATVSAHQHLVRSIDKNIIPMDNQQPTDPNGNKTKVPVGYDKGRIELSGYVSIRYRPTERLGLSIGLREEMFGSEWTPIIPAFFTDYLISKRPLPVAERPLLPAGRQPRPEKGARLHLRRRSVVRYGPRRSLHPAGRSHLVRLLHRQLDRLAAYGQRILDAQKRQGGACLRRGGESGAGRTVGQRLAVERRRQLLVAPLDQPRRPGGLVRQGDRQTARLHPRIFGFGNGAPDLPFVAVHLQMVLLQRAFHHLGQRYEDQDRTCEALLHERHFARKSLLVPLGRPLA